MIVVSVELWSAVSGAKTQLARMHISNDGEASQRNPRVGDYVAETFVGRDANTLAKGRVSKRAVIRNWRRLDYHVWNLVRRALDVMGYTKGALPGLPYADATPDIGIDGGLAIDGAPKDGRMLRLLVDYSGDDGAHALADSADPVWTIGFNNLGNTGVDEWQFAGWCWSHDHFTEGKGRPIGWLPYEAALPAGQAENV